MGKTNQPDVVGLRILHGSHERPLSENHPFNSFALPCLNFQEGFHPKIR